MTIAQHISPAPRGFGVDGDLRDPGAEHAGPGVAFESALVDRDRPGEIAAAQGSIAHRSSIAPHENAIAIELVHVLHSWIAEVAPSASRHPKDTTAYRR